MEEIKILNAQGQELCRLQNKHGMLVDGKKYFAEYIDDSHFKADGLSDCIDIAEFGNKYVEKGRVIVPGKLIPVEYQFESMCNLYYKVKHREALYTIVDGAWYSATDWPEPDSPMKSGISMMVFDSKGKYHIETT